MIRNRPTVNDPEIRLRVIRNVSGQSLVRGDAVYYLAPNDPSAGATPGGIYVGLPTANRIISLFAGLIYDDAGLADGALGLIQTNGFANYARVLRDTGFNIAIGGFLQGVVGDTTLTYSAEPFSHVVAMEAVPLGTAVVAARSVFLRCPE